MRTVFSFFSHKEYGNDKFIVQELTMSDIPEAVHNIIDMPILLLSFLSGNETGSTF